MTSQIKFDQYGMNVLSKYLVYSWSQLAAVVKTNNIIPNYY